LSVRGRESRAAIPKKWHDEEQSLGPALGPGKGPDNRNQDFGFVVLMDLMRDSSLAEFELLPNSRKRAYFPQHISGVLTPSPGLRSARMGLPGASPSRHRPHFLPKKGVIWSENQLSECSFVDSR
jgi:hypothetical protein